MKKRLLALLVLALVMVISLVSCGDPIGDWLGISTPEETPEVELEEYVVYFTAGEGINIPSQTIKEGGLITRPEDPYKEGYLFDNWYKDEACTKVWNFETDTVTKNTILYGNWIEHTHTGGNATCTDKAVCEVCGKEYGSTLSHRGGTATCTEAAVCELCGASYGSALGHTVVVDEAVAPTCTETGLTEGAHCSACDEVLVAQEVVAATGHTTVVDEAVSATCTEAGLTEGSHCSVCDEVLVAQEVVPATGHTWGDWIVDAEPTFDAEGSKHRECACGEVETVTIPSLSHTHSYTSEVTTAPTCTEDGVKTHTCSCGDTYTEAVPALGHTESAAVVENNVDPTCIAAGSYDTVVYCSVCDEELSRTTTTVDALGHTESAAVVENNVDPTCTTAGSYDTVVYCSVCDEEISRTTTTVDALGHKDENGDFKCDNECGKVVEPADGTALTIEQAEALASLFAHNTYTTNKYYVTCEIKNVYNTQYGNINIVGSDFVIYGLYSADGETRYDAMSYKPTTGDEITVYGVIGKYNSTLQMKNGRLDEVVAHEHDYSDATCEALATCSICGATTGELADHDYVDGTCSVCGKEENSTEPVETWTLVTDASQLVDGAEIVIVAAKYNFALGSQNGNYRNRVAIVKNADNTVTINDDVQIITIVIKDGKILLQVSAGQYLYAVGGSNNHLKTSSTINDAAKWDITISNGTASVKSNVDSTRNALMYNSNSGQERFSCYAGTQQAVSIYIKTVNTPAECQHEGGNATCEELAVCTKCGESYGELADCVEGTPVVENNVAPDCVNAGSYETVVYCSVCGEELSRETTTVNALGHTEGEAAKENNVAPTCTAAGSYETVVNCTVCGEEISRATTTVDALGHTEVIDAAVAATCKATGLTEGKHCSVCNAVLVEQTTVPTVPHTYDDKYDAECNECGFIRDAECAHTNTEVVPGYDATCTAAGLTDGVKCSKCGETLTAQEAIDALGHAEVVDQAVAPDCENTGLTEGKHCSRCNEVLVSQTVVAANGHTEVIDKAVDATCEATGLTEGKHCSVCNEILVAQEVVSATGHAEVVDAAVAPTCTTAGKTEGKHCSVCNEVLVAQETVEALGHTDENRDFKCEVCTKIAEPADGTALTLEEATKLGLLYEHDKYTTNKYYVTGIIVAVENTTYGNISIKTLDGGTFYTYGLYTWDGATRYDKMTYKPVAGDEITIYGVIGQFSGKAQMKSAWLDEVVKHNNEHVWNHDATCDNPATCIMCGVKNTVAHTRSENELTCSTPIICTVCNNVLESVEHVDENKNGRCDVCKAGVPISAGEEEIVFDLGANGAAAHKDGNKITSYTKTVDGYTLTLESLTNIYSPAYDAKGNSVLKLGTSSNTGSFKFTVPSDVTSVDIYVAKYKANTSKVNINGKEYTLTKNSNDGAYDVITVDTTSTKTVTIATVSGGVRAMVNTIVFKVPGEVKEHSHNPGEAVRENVVNATCIATGSYDEVVYCTDADCGEEVSRTKKELPLADHTPGEAVEENRVDSTCKVAGSYDSVVYCTVCGEIVDREEVTLPLADHTPGEAKVENNVAPDCENAGSYETVVYCSVCGTELSRVTTTVNALGHTEGEATIENNVAPDCENAGSYDTVVKCSVCGEELSRETTTVPALGHTAGDATVENNVAPNCVNGGSYDTVVKCSVCGEELSRETTTVPALGHTYGTWYATYVSFSGTGTEKHDCSCGHFETREADAVKHHTITFGTAGNYHSVSVEGVDLSNIKIGDNGGNNAQIKEGYITVALKAGAVLTINAYGGNYTDFNLSDGTTSVENIKDKTYVYTTEVDVVVTISHVYGQNGNNYFYSIDINYPVVIREDTDITFGSAGNYKTVDTINISNVQIADNGGNNSQVKNGYISFNVKAGAIVTVHGYSGYTSYSINGSEAITDEYYSYIASADEEIVITSLSSNNYFYSISVTYVKYVEGNTVVSFGSAGNYHNPGEGIKLSVTVGDNGGNNSQVKNGNITINVKAGGKVIVNGYPNYTNYTFSDGEITVDITDTTYIYTAAEDVTVTITVGNVNNYFYSIAVEYEHEYSSVVTAPTCEAAGYTTHTCALCGDSYTDSEVAATGHNYESTVTKAATCTEAGVRTYTCKNDASHTYTEAIEATGHAEVNHEGKAATCTADGWKAYVTCENCDYTTYEKIGALDHTEETVAGKAATCTENGLTDGKKCSACGETLVAQEVVPAIQHNYTSVVTTPATCEGKGLRTYTCQNDAAHTYTEEIPATGHTDNGKGHCSVCGKNICENHVEAIESGYAATCDDNGRTDRVYCSICGDTITPSEVILATGHNYEASVTAPTCEADGYTTHTCANGCGRSYVDTYVDALGHNYTVAYGVVEGALKLVYTCQNDNSHIYSESVDTRVAVPVTNEADFVTALTNGFDVVLNANIDLTATVEVVGVTATIDLNGKTLKADWESSDVVEVLHIHDGSHITIIGEGNVVSGGQYTAGTNSVISCRIDSTLTIEGGNYYSASYGDVIFCETRSIVYINGGHFEAATTYDGIWFVLDIDENEDSETRGKFVVTGGTFVSFNPANHVGDADYTNKVANGYHSINNNGVYTVSAHSYDAVVTAPNCVDKGYTTHTCVCGNSYVDTYVDALGHSYNAVVTAPDCVNGGYTTYTCSVCGDSYVADEVAALGHSYNAVVTAPTCEAAGYTTYTCSVCGDSYVADEVAATGHNYESTITKAATCTEAGVRTYTCKNDASHTYTEAIKALGHTEETVAGKAATCTENGLTDGKKCSACGVVLVAQETITAPGHTTVVDAAVAATCTTAGKTEGSHCSACGETLVAQETIDALGHTTVVDAAVAATCTTAGKTEGSHCSVCETVLVAQNTIPAGHTNANNDNYCDVCGVRMPETAIDVTFNLGADGSATHADGTGTATYTETKNGIKLSIVSGTNMYKDAIDAKGNSCIKLGTSSGIGSFSFTVPSNVNKVTIEVAQYKSNTTKVKINDITHTITTASNNGAYTSIEVDTSSNKTVTITTVEGANRAMVNSISLEGCGHEYNAPVKVDPQCEIEGSITSVCKHCGATAVDTLEATGHTYINGVCSCGAKETDVEFVVPEGIDEVVMGEGNILPSANAPDEYTFVGWSETELEETTETPELLKAGEVYIGTATTLYAVYSGSKEMGGSSSFVKVTSAPSDWSGTYLIVYEDGKVAFDGSRTTLDAVSNTINVTISNNTIAATDALKKSTFTIAKSGSNYTLKSASGYFVGQTTNANGLKSSTSSSYNHTITMNSDKTINFVSGGAYLRYNASSGQYRFRYYKSGSYTSQKAICLFQLVETAGTVSTYYTTLK